MKEDKSSKRMLLTQKVLKERTVGDVMCAVSHCSYRMKKTTKCEDDRNQS